MRNKTTAFINILGLSLGMTGCVLILNYVSFEKSFDGFHANADRIYRITNKITHDGEDQGERAIVFPAAGPAMKEYFPEVAAFARLHSLHGVVSHKEVVFKEDRMFYADPALLTVFSFPLVKGAAPGVLQEPFTVVITESMATKYFGKEDPVGKAIQIRDQDFNTTYTVSGVMKDVPENSHLKFDFLTSFATLEKLTSVHFGLNANSNWEWDMFYTYILLRPEAPARQVERRLAGFVNTYLGSLQKVYNKKNAFRLQPLLSIHLHSALLYEAGPNGDGNLVNFLWIIALFIVVIAWINYINISTAQATARAKEVGVRKVMGAERSQLVKQYLLESGVMNVLALMVTLVFIVAVLPFFTDFLGRSRTNLFAFLAEIALQFRVALLAFFVLGALLSGVYAAFILSSFKPIEALSRKIADVRKGASFRKGLIIFQFAVSFALIAGTFIIFQQIQFMRNQNLGINIEQILVLEAPNVKSSTSPEEGNPESFFKSELLNYPAVSRVTLSSNIPGREHNRGANGVRRKNSDAREGKFYNIMGIDHDFIPAFGLKLLAGRNFYGETGSNNKSAIVNQTALRMLGFAEPQQAINEEIIFSGTFMKIVGVIEDYHHQSLKKSITPTIFFPYVPADNNYYSVKVKTADLQSATALIEAQWKAAFPGIPVQQYFLDDFFNQQYQTDQKFGKMFSVFAVLAILVACLGLFGFSLYNVRQRTREVSIRKILGASLASNLMLLLNQSLKLVAVAFLLACPVVYYLSAEWLNNYPFHIQQDVLTYVVSGCIVMLIAVLTVIYQVVKTIRVNPSSSLRNE